MLTKSNILKIGWKVPSALIIAGICFAPFNDTARLAVRIYFALTAIFYLTCILNIGLYRNFVKIVDPFLRSVIAASACFFLSAALYFGLQQILEPLSFLNFELSIGEEGRTNNALDLVAFVISLGFAIYSGCLIFRDMRMRLADLVKQIENAEGARRKSPLYQK